MCTLRKSVTTAFRNSTNKEDLKQLMDGNIRDHCFTVKASVKSWAHVGHLVEVSRICPIAQLMTPLMAPLKNMQKRSTMGLR